MARLIWSPRAAEDLRNICDYIAKDSEQFARVVAQQVISAVERIPDHPHAGSIVPEYNSPEIRERFIYSYRIICRIRKETIELVSICHGARLLPDELDE